MTTTTDIVNRSLQQFGSRTTVTAAELAANSTNEAIQANISLISTRDELLRMAPWNCSVNYNLMTYITSIPGTPENQSISPQFWQKGLPSPPWAYEYQYPVDCLRPLWIVPQVVTGFAGGIPITTATTGGAASTWMGPPVRFKVEIDQFVPVIAVAVSNGGLGYAVNDIITLVGAASGLAPVGAPVVLLVTSIGGGGTIASVTIVNQIAGASPSQGGSYFLPQTNPVAQGSTSGVGTGATFNLTFGAKSDQRVIVTNQENAILCYIKQILDPNVMDPLFLDAWTSILGARLSIALTGDKALANIGVADANASVQEARKADGNEGLTINNVTPDWIRIRGSFSPFTSGGTPGIGFDWGNLFPNY